MAEAAASPRLSVPSQVHTKLPAGIYSLIKTFIDLPNASKISILVLPGSRILNFRDVVGLKGLG